MKDRDIMSLQAPYQEDQKALNSLTEDQYNAIKSRLSVLLQQERLLPVEQRMSKVELLIAAGYPSSRAMALANTLIENGKETIIVKRGFDQNSAKLTIQELTHDETLKPELRLKGAELMAKATGLLKDAPTGDGASTILAGMLRDIFNNSSSTPKVVSVQSAESNG